jgi:hypothetical protein
MATGYAAVVRPASSLRAPLPVLRLRQGVPVSPSAGRAQGQPPDAGGGGGGCAAPARKRVVGGRNDGFLDHVRRRQAQVLRVPPELRNGAGARWAQEVPLLGRAVSVANGVGVHGLGFRVLLEGF